MSEQQCWISEQLSVGPEVLCHDGPSDQLPEWSDIYTAEGAQGRAGPAVQRSEGLFHRSVAVYMNKYGSSNHFEWQISALAGQKPQGNRSQFGLTSPFFTQNLIFAPPSSFLAIIFQFSFGFLQCDIHHEGGRGEEGGEPHSGGIVREGVLSLPLRAL